MLAFACLAALVCGAAALALAPRDYQRAGLRRAAMLTRRRQEGGAGSA